MFQSLLKHVPNVMQKGCRTCCRSQQGTRLWGRILAKPDPVVESWLGFWKLFDCRYRVAPSHQTHLLKWLAGPSLWTACPFMTHALCQTIQGMRHEWVLHWDVSVVLPSFESSELSKQCSFFVLAQLLLMTVSCMLLSFRVVRKSDSSMVL